MTREEAEDALMDVIGLDEQGDAKPMLKMLTDAVLKKQEFPFKDKELRRIIYRLRKAIGERS